MSQQHKTVREWIEQIRSKEDTEFLMPLIKPEYTQQCDSLFIAVLSGCNMPPLRDLKRFVSIAHNLSEDYIRVRGEICTGLERDIEFFSDLDNTNYVIHGGFKNTQILLITARACDI